MIPILCGTGTALCWALAAMTSAKATRMIGSVSTLSAAMVAGLVASVPFLLVNSTDDYVPGHLGWLLVSSVCAVLGLLALYAGFRVGKVAVVTALSSTDGAVAAGLSIASGERISTGLAVGLALVVTGVIITGACGRRTVEGGSFAGGAAFGLCAAILLGITLFTAARAERFVPVSWVLAGPRVVGVLFMAAPLALARRLQLRTSVFPAIVVAGVAEVVGFGLFVAGAAHNVSVTAVFASQNAAIAALAAFVFFSERLSRLQVAGMATIAIGVATVALVRA